MPKKVRTEKEAIESSIQNIFLIEKELQKEFSDPDTLINTLPGCIHLNPSEDISLKYASHDIQEIYQASSEEIRQRGLEIMEKCVHPEDFISVPKLIINFLAKWDKSDSFSFFQRTLTRINLDEYRWFYTSSKILKSNPDYLLSVSHFVDNLIVTANQVNKLLEDHVFIRKNLQKFLSLTKREKEILVELAKGKTAPQIAEMKFISLFTVKTHRQRIFQKLEVKTYLDLYQYALHFDLLD